MNEKPKRESRNEKPTNPVCGDSLGRAGDWCGTSMRPPTAMQLQREGLALKAKQQQLKAQVERLAPFDADSLLLEMPPPTSHDHGPPPLPHVDIPRPPPGLAPARVRELLGECRGPRRAVVSHPGEILRPSRAALLQAFDACHEFQGWRRKQDTWRHERASDQRQIDRSMPCALRLVWPDEQLTKAVRLAATVDIYRGMTGDMSTPDHALAEHALLVAKKRDCAHKTPSAIFRRWLAEAPFPSSSYQSPAMGSIGYEYAITPDKWVESARLGGSPTPETRRSRTPPPMGSAFDASDQRRSRSNFLPGPSDYDQTSGTLGASMFDRSTSSLPGSFGKRMRRSASFASSRPRSSGVIDGKVSTGPRKGPKGPPMTPDSNPCAASSTSPSMDGHVYPGIDLARVATIFSKFGDGRFIECRDLWGALHHYGVQMTSKYAHRVVNWYGKFPGGQLEKQDFAAIIRQIEAPEDERQRREEEAEAARAAAIERAHARAEAEERSRRESAADWAHSTALGGARAKAEEARELRARYEANAAEAQAGAQVAATGERSSRPAHTNTAELAPLIAEAEQDEHEWRRVAQEAASDAESWRDEQRQADMRRAWEGAWNEAEMQSGRRKVHGERTPKYEWDARSFGPEEASQRVHRVAFASSQLPSPTFTQPSPIFTPKRSQNVGVDSPQGKLRLQAAEKELADAMAALARAQREVYGAAMPEAARTPVLNDINYLYA